LFNHHDFGSILDCYNEHFNKQGYYAKTGKACVPIFTEAWWCSKKKKKKRQAMYILHNIEVCSCNQCGRGKATIITHYE